MGEMHNIEQLIKRFWEDDLSENEKVLLQQWITSSQENQQLYERLTNSVFVGKELKKLYAFSEEQAWTKVQNRIGSATQSSGHVVSNNTFVAKTSRLRQYWLAAAVLTGLIFFSAAFSILNRPAPSSKTVAHSKTQDVPAPLISKAVIRLDDGRTIVLDTLGVGEVVTVGNMQVTRNSSGELVYTGSEALEVYNTVINPRGSRVVSLVLHDGTKVWLNSESSLRYPIAFVGSQRKVEVEGEAYFEVAKDASRKFIVEGNGVQTEVLGTHFNVNTYKDESQTRITLLEGRVAVRKGTSKGMLSPGQQAAFGNQSDEMLIHEVDTDKVMGWHSGVFHFEDENLATIMRELTRWYDIDVRYKGDIPSETYGGIISRNESLFTVLKTLRTAGVKFTREGNLIVIEYP